MSIADSFNRLGNRAFDWALDKVMLATANYIPYEARLPCASKQSEQKNTPV